MVRMLSIGFTGTRHGMTSAQWHALRSELDLAIVVGEPWIARHGMCVGSDEQFHRIVRLMPNGEIHGHPCDIVSMRGMILDCDVVHPPKRPLVRNVDIVEPSTMMFATPYEDAEQLRGGTWSTICKARKAGKPLAIVLPSGEVVKERWM